MISFMVLSLPRSASTWAANWLCTEQSHCIHDPLHRYHWSELDSIPSKGKVLGVACTGLYLFPKVVAAHPAKKLILHRDVKEINADLDSLGFAKLPEDSEYLLDNISGLHVPYSELFTAPEKLWKYLIGTAVDLERHAELCTIAMQPAFTKLVVNKEITETLLSELRST